MNRDNARKRQIEAGNHPDQTNMDYDTWIESCAEHYRWTTGKEHQRWLKKTKRKRLKFRPDSCR